MASSPLSDNYVELPAWVDPAILPRHTWIPLLKFPDMKVLRFDVQGGMYAVMIDFEEQLLLGEIDVTPDEPPWTETMFGMIVICPHCEQQHNCRFVWSGRFGLFVADPGGMDWGDIPPYSDYAQHADPAWLPPARRVPDA
jgi:hypothetical protein